MDLKTEGLADADQIAQQISLNHARAARLVAEEVSELRTAGETAGMQGTGRSQLAPTGLRRPEMLAKVHISYTYRCRRGLWFVSLIAARRAWDPVRIGRYRVVGVLGAGGMGTVYAAVGERGERVAVKVVHAGQVADEQFRARFRRGVQVLARVSGPCLVPLLDADPEAETPWLATAYVPGLTLSQHAAAHGPLAGIRLHLFAAGTARALAAVHAAGVVHRDLKPANVILAPDGPRVLDFGIAHDADGTAVTRSGMLTGTPGWLSPEYYRDGSAGPPGDVFAWGALLAFAATGRHPFGTGTAEAVAFRVLQRRA
ncbi:serine/threonine-protein kinase [Streptomyces sp. NPDC046900]|uniref:serine/threonine-protein kinase n=1 Tax=Streptomyces sp. NPDC046900 TaxID=3155473 RepID=UPI0033C692E0